MKKLVKLSVITIIIFTLSAGTAFAAGTVIVQNDPNADFLNLPAGSGWVNYFAGTCEGKCRLNGTITHKAKEAVDQVPLTFIRGMYMRIIGKGQGGGYLACIPASKVNNPELWVFEAGVWKYVSSYVNSDGAICTTYAGDGVFGLFGQEPDQSEDCVVIFTENNSLDLGDFLYQIFFNGIIFDPCVGLNI